ncbi:MAG: hypothetical protein AABZ53_04810 [Planctomycetota bacterium]
MTHAPNIDEFFTAWCNHKGNHVAIQSDLNLDASQLLGLLDDPEFIRRTGVWNSTQRYHSGCIALDHRIAAAAHCRQLLNSSDPVEARHALTKLCTLANAIAKGPFSPPRSSRAPKAPSPPTNSPPNPPHTSPPNSPPTTAAPPHIITRDIIAHLRGDIPAGGPALGGSPLSGAALQSDDPPPGSHPTSPAPPPPLIVTPHIDISPRSSAVAAPVEHELPATPSLLRAPPILPASSDAVAPAPQAAPIALPELKPITPSPTGNSPAAATPCSAASAVPRPQRSCRSRDAPSDHSTAYLERLIEQIKSDPALARRYPPSALTIYKDP